MTAEDLGAFACSLLADTTVTTRGGTLELPWSGSARYTGETVAVMNKTSLTGTATVDVNWNNTSSLTMALTISDLADGDGDPLHYNQQNDNGTGVEIADIVFPAIARNASGNDASRLYFQTSSNCETADGTATRYRPAGAGAEIPRAETGHANATFVGQGVDGPLGVIGTWRLADEWQVGSKATALGLWRPTAQLRALVWRMTRR